MLSSAGEADRGADRGGVETGQRELYRDQVEAGEGGRVSRASPRLQGKSLWRYSVNCDFLSLLTLMKITKKRLPISTRPGTRL